MAGLTYSWPTIRSRTNSTATYRMGAFKEEGLTAGVAFGEDGTARGAMGVDAADYDRSGRQHLIVGNFSNQMIGLYHNEGNGLFVDEAPRSPLGRASLLSLTFGLFFFDYDLDGYPDLLAANGHIEEQIGRVQPKIQYAELPLLMHNNGHGRFDQVNAFTRPLVARGAAYGDFDHDGDLDVLVAQNNGPAVLYRNDGGNRNHWLQLKLVGSKSNRDGIGAVARVISAGGSQWQMVHSGSSYCSASDLALTFGLGKDGVASTIEIEWPSGARQKLANVAGQSATDSQGTMNEVLSCSGVAQARLIREGEISSAELVEAHLERIAEVNPRLNAVVEVLAEPAREGARAADVRRAGGAPWVRSMAYRSRSRIPLRLRGPVAARVRSGFATLRAPRTILHWWPGYVRLGRFRSRGPICRICCSHSRATTLSMDAPIILTMGREAPADRAAVKRH